MERAGGARDRGGRERPRPLHPGAPARSPSSGSRDVRPWCISRQLWWGHQLPVWYCADGHMTCAETTPDACAECGCASWSATGRARHVVLVRALAVRDARLAGRDARAASASTPATCYSTARDIIFLWVARMILLGLELLGRRPVPRRDHPLDRPRARRAADVEEPRHRHRPARADRPHGADATRYGLLKMSSTQDVRFSDGSIEEGRKLANKLWNVARLILAQTEASTPDAPPGVARGALDPRPPRRGARRGRGGARRLRLRARGHVLYHLTFDDFCDWYAEAIKPRLYDGDEDARATALAALERLLTLLHPVMPHVTEEIWSQLPPRVAADRRRRGPSRTCAYAAAAERSTRVQEAAESFRRSGVRSQLDGDEQRIFDAVVRPERREGERRTSRPSGAAAQGDRAGREDARERALRRERAGRRRRGRAGEARALPARARRPRR